MRSGIRKNTAGCRSGSADGMSDLRKWIDPNRICISAAPKASANDRYEKRDEKTIKNGGFENEKRITSTETKRESQEEEFYARRTPHDSGSL